ncbi:MAG: iron-sulfur cluster assembly accessory protein [Nitrospirae bacterium]|nr:iron-sulfur cluster assembly accessory protein [Nitrospirota bacterium]
MVTITSQAADKAKEFLAKEGKDGWGLRLSLYGGGCSPSYGLDIAENPEAGDEVVEQNGLRVFVDKDASAALSGMEIDYVDDGSVQGFVLRGGEQPSCGPSCSSCG